MTKTGFILLGHGSKRKEWQIPFERLLARLEETTGKDQFFLAYLESSKPSLEEVVASLAKKKEKIYIWPLFLSLGGHVGQDIPKILENLRKKYSLPLILLPCLGEWDEFWDFLYQQSLHLWRGQKEP